MSNLAPARASHESDFTNAEGREVVMQEETFRRLAFHNIDLLRIVRRNGYAIDREEYLPGVICVGAAIRDQAGTVIGAISASTPTMRATDEHIALMRDQITAATRGLSAEFGEPGSQNGERPQAVAN